MSVNAEVTPDDHWGDVLPKQIDAEAVEILIFAIEEALSDSPSIKDALEACELQPTTRANWLAASAAVHVLLAHEIGQEVGSEGEP